MRRTKRLIASVFASALLVVGVTAPTASAQPVEQDGLINVVIYDVTIQDVVDVVVEDVNIGVAAQVAANICGVKVGPVAVLGTAVDRSGDFRTVCQTGNQQIRLIQN
jgi:hypothetical protein